ncbi:MAG: hypothetical protein GY757_61675 [bacterium]|nr:hypothetical protein [bacterium]
MNNQEEVPTPDPTGTTDNKKRESNSFASTLKKAANMSAAIAEHQVELAARGLNETNLEYLNTILAGCQSLDGEQEILKGTLKAKTAELGVKVSELKKCFSQYSKIIKAIMPQERWVDFGITAKQ